ncbi:hypothetical protein QTP88_005216 [Uroleucon formosanum]
MDWTDEECLLLIEMFKARPIIWDPTNSKEMNKNVNEFKRKMESLKNNKLNGRYMCSLDSSVPTIEY